MNECGANCECGATASSLAAWHWQWHWQQADDNDEWRRAIDYKMNGVRLLGAFAAGSTATLAGFAFANAYPAAETGKAAASCSVSENKQRLQFEAACAGANHEAPIEKWDHNWDGRDPRSMVRPPRQFHAEDPAKVAEWSARVAKFTPETTRHIFLIRHGQYNEEGETDEEKYLTPLGSEQAALTGDRMAVLLAKLKSR